MLAYVVQIFVVKYIDVLFVHKPLLHANACKHSFEPSCNYISASASRHCSVVVVITKWFLDNCNNAQVCGILR